MALLDGSIVNVALPSIREKLHASGAALQMVVAGYIIAYAVLLVTGARLGRILGHGRLFKAGLAGFTVASLACGLAQNTGELIVFRVLQGIAAALMVPQVLSLIQRTFQGAARAKAMSAWTAVLASGIVVGQVVGGVLVSANLFGWSWRPVFLVNVPIGIVLYSRRPSLPSLKPQKTAAAGRHPRPADALADDPGPGGPAGARPRRALAALGLGPAGRHRSAACPLPGGRAPGGARRPAADPPGRILACPG